MDNTAMLSLYRSLMPVIVLLVLSDLILRGVALFRSAQKNQKVWFVFLLIVNSLGILPIIYLLVNKDVRLSRTTKTAKVVKKAKK
jgi:hypothetical protein